MEDLEQVTKWYKKARLQYIIRFGILLQGIPYGLLMFVFYWFFISDSELYKAIVTGLFNVLFFGILMGLSTFTGIYKLPNVKFNFEQLNFEFPKLSDETKFLLSFYILKHGKAQRFRNEEFFLKDLKKLSRMLAIRYTVPRKDELPEMMKFAYTLS